MRISEDAMQDARLKLIELGGPSAVGNPDGWLVAHARAAQYETIRRDVRVEAAACEAAGVYNSRAHALLAAWRKENAEGARRYRQTPEGRAQNRKSAAVYYERHGEAERAEQRKRYAKNRQSPEWRARWNAQRREAYRLRVERQRAAA